MPAWITRLLAHPLARDADIDDPETTQRRARIIQEKPLLRRVYRTWHTLVAEAIPERPSPVLELGAGAGWFQAPGHDVLRSDVLPLPGLDARCTGLALPFRANALAAIAGFNVLHHIPDLRRFFAEAAHCVAPAGKILLLEPWVTPFSRLVYARLHYEPFDPDAPDWSLASAGPLSGANNALPWIVFERDRDIFARDFPQWRIRRLLPLSGLGYYLSGGVSMRKLVPDCLTEPIITLDALLTRAWSGGVALFCFIELEKEY